MAARAAEHRAPPPKRFTRRWYIDQAGTVAWTIVITMLVWVYADIHFTQNRAVPITLRVRNGSPDELVILKPRSDTIPVRVEIQGGRFALDRLERASKLSFDAAKRFRTAGEHTVPAADLLGELSAIARAGKILSCKPDTLLFQIDTLKKVPDVEVRLDLPGVDREKVQLQPDRVTLYVPTSQVSEVVSESLVILARLSNPGSLPEGQPVTRQVPLLKPTPDCRLVPKSVLATFTIALGQQIREREFTVPIRVQSPKQWLLDGTWGQYQFEEQPPRRSIAKVVISGPQIELDRLRPEDIDVFLTLTDAHKKPLDSWLPGKLRVEFRKDPDINVSALTVVGPLPEIQFKLVKRTKPATP